MAFSSWALAAEPVGSAAANRVHGRQGGRRRSAVVEPVAVLMAGSSDATPQQPRRSTPVDINGITHFASRFRQRLGSALTSHSATVHSLLQGVSHYLPKSAFWLDSRDAYQTSQDHHHAPDDFKPVAATATMVAAKPTAASKQPNAAAPSESVSQPLLAPFLDRADKLEVQYAALLADMSNMAYEADKVRGCVNMSCGRTTLTSHGPDEQVEDHMLARHKLAFVSHSATAGLGPITREQHWDKIKQAHSEGLTSEQMQSKERQESHARHHLPQLQSEHSLAARTTLHDAEAQSLQSVANGGVAPLHPESVTPSVLMGIASSQGLSAVDAAAHDEDFVDHSSFRHRVDHRHRVHHHGGSPLRPDIEYSILLGSIEELLPEDDEYLHRVRGAEGTVQHMMVQQLLGSLESMDSADCESALASIEEEMSRAACKSMTLAHFTPGNGLDSLSSLDDPTWPINDDPLAAPGATKEEAPLISRRSVIPTSPIQIPGTPLASLSDETGLHVHVARPPHSPAAAAADPDRMPGSPQSESLVQHPEPPAAWFVADDPVSKVRYFVIQGSTSFEHWTINFKFDPVIFEDPALGVRVHRGVYEASLRMYEQLLPLLQQHMRSAGPGATISLSGHSLGGSLASVLMLLFVHRKVIPASALSPCYTFGAPAVFCAGGGPIGHRHPCEACQHNCDEATRRAEAESCLGRRPVMEKLGIPDDMLHNVIMHKDIVPR